MNHIACDAFGNVASETNASVDHLFGYTGRAFDESTGLQNNLNRWYDATTGLWMSEDPIGFSAGDPNFIGMWRILRRHMWMWTAFEGEVDPGPAFEIREVVTDETGTVALAVVWTGTVTP